MKTYRECRLRWLMRVTLAGTLLTAFVILVGAWTRLVDAGLGCLIGLAVMANSLFPIVIMRRFDILMLL